MPESPNSPLGVETMPDYSALDEGIVLHLKNILANVHPTAADHLLRVAADALGRKYRRDDDGPFRLIDRRLQALRKAGKIALVNRKWRVV